MSHKNGKDQVVRVTGNTDLSRKVTDTVNLWRSCSGGPEVGFAPAVRHLTDIGTRFEEIRLLESYYPYDVEQAFQLFVAALRRSPRTPTHAELESGRIDSGVPGDDNPEGSQ